MLSKQNRQNHAVFLDRDGVINPLVWNLRYQTYDSPHVPEEISLLPGVAESIVLLEKAEYFLIVVSNQPSAAKGKCSLADLKAVHEQLERLIFEKTNLKLKDYFYCYHHPESVDPGLKKRCLCRKPGNELFKIAAKKYNIDMASSWMVGDRDVDIAAGKNSKTRTILLDYPCSKDQRQKNEADFLAQDLKSAVEIILGS